jgi:hypothetical protein
MSQPWTEAEDSVVLSKSRSEAARLLNRTKEAVTIRKGKLRRKLSLGPVVELLSPDEAKLRIAVPRYDSKEQEDKVRFVGGPYEPPFVPIGGWLRCMLRGRLQVGGYSNSLIPWPVAGNHPRQLVVCGDLAKALRTESRLAVCFHFGISPQTVSEYKRQLGIERLTAGSTFLFWRNVRLAGSAAARAKMSRQREGRKDLMTPEDRERLREIQKRPKSAVWKAKASKRWQRRYALLGKPKEWTEAEMSLLNTRPDREVAKLVDRSVGAVKAKKFQLLRLNREKSPS